MEKNVELLEKVESKFNRLESMDLVTDENKNKLERLKNLTKHNSDNWLVLEEINNILLEFINDLEEKHKLKHTNKKTESIEIAKSLEETFKTIEKQSRLKEFINDLEEKHKLKHTNKKTESIENVKLLEEISVDEFENIEKQARLKTVTDYYIKIPLSETLITINTDLEMIRDTMGNYPCGDRLFNKYTSSFNKFDLLIKNIMSRFYNNELRILNTSKLTVSDYSSIAEKIALEVSIAKKIAEFEKIHLQNKKYYYNA